MVVKNVVWLLGTGVALGLPLAVAAAYLMRDLLFGIEPQDIRVLLSSSAAILFVGLVAGWIPAHQATHADPIATLRVE